MSHFCNKCDKRFVFGTTMRIHYKRKRCKVTKDRIGSAILSERTKTKTDNKCEYCSRTFRFETTLKRHEKKMSHNIAVAILNNY